MSSHRKGTPSHHSRRTFVKGLAMSGAAASLGLLRTGVSAQGNAPQPWTTLAGSDFDLRIGETPMNITGARRTDWRLPPHLS